MSETPEKKLSYERENAENSEGWKLSEPDKILIDLQQIPVMTNKYIMIALRDSVVLPGISTNIDIGRDKSMIALNKALERREKLFLAPQKLTTLNPAPKDIFRIGTVCEIKQVLKLPSDIIRVTVEGVFKAEIKSFVALNPCFEVEAEEIVDAMPDPYTLAALKIMLKDYLLAYNKLESKLSDVCSDNDIDANPDRFCNLIANALIVKQDKKREFLAQNTLEKRLEIICGIIYSETEILKIEKKLAAKVRKSIDTNQKEYYLREQAKAIHEELGDDEDEIEEYRRRAEGTNLPQEAIDKVKKEIGRMQKMSPTSPESAVSRSYIEWILDLPWKKNTEDNKDIARAREILDADHYGLEKVKQRILEYLSVLQLTNTLKGPILCFVGPPGVGKTSIVKSIASTLDRKFVSMSLGGVRDEAELRGHRRTYIGAIPGRIIYHMKQVGSSNPVFLLDEIDKVSSDQRGDPASVLLEILDPEQNFQFRDHYLELPYDLSKVLFITTANTLDTIPAPLLDRMEIIELSGYTEEEKAEIGKRYLLPKQQEFNGLKDAKINIDDETMRHIISAYTRESGVRSLEREMAAVCRKIAHKIVSESGQEKAKQGKSKKAKTEEQDTLSNVKGREFTITVDNSHEYLGIPKFIDHKKGTNEIGVATGLAWTSVGGKTMPIEVTLIPGGKGEILLTGQLGDVMKESARTAISLVRSRAGEWGIDNTLFTSSDIHLHVPEGATPKDGPSAGITIATAIMSAFSHRAVNSDVAMTGEITLRGKVLPIGGLKEKILAAHRFGIKKIIVPQENSKDMQEIPENIKSKLEIVFAENINTVFDAAIL